MSQPVPSYTEADLDRVVARDYPGRVEQVLRILAQYGKERWHDEPLRVRMACLKLGKGDTRELEKYLRDACQDYRDVLAWAEYPTYMTAWTAEARTNAEETDWKQLQNWLYGRPEN